MPCRELLNNSLFYQINQLRRGSYLDEIQEEKKGKKVVDDEHLILPRSIEAPHAGRIPMGGNENQAVACSCVRRFNAKNFFFASTSFWTRF